MKLPSFLESVNHEFISIDGKLFQVQVKLVPFKYVEPLTRQRLMDEMEADHDAVSALDKLGIPFKDARLEKYVECNYGGFDDVADYDKKDGAHHEYFDCGLRGSCPVEGKLCKRIKVENGSLTSREIEIIKLIGQDKMDKEIADILDISLNTATTHRQNITRKMGGITKAGIAAFASQKGLI
jgi:DNA-binding CsgD family transcriptional regulator